MIAVQESKESGRKSCLTGAQTTLEHPPNFDTRATRVFDLTAEKEGFHRSKVDERENPGTGHRNNDLWSPMRSTVVYVGTTAIGLTVIEMSEEAEARHVNGEYVRLTGYVPKRRGR